MADQRPDPITKAANSTTPGIPRSIRARTGQTTDPVPEGFDVESPKRHFPIEPAEHDVDRTKPKSPEELGVSESQLAVKSAAGEGNEGSNAVAKELAHQNAVEEMRWRSRQQEWEMRQKEMKQKEGPPNKSLWQGQSTAANKQMDSRSGQRPFTM